MRWLRSAVVAMAFALGGAACAPIEIQYRATPGSMYGPYAELLERQSLAPAQVEVVDRHATPWEYVVVGELQEAHRGSISGGLHDRTMLFQEVAAQHGCDGVVMNGNVSVFDGRYEHRSPRRRSSDRSGRGGTWVPIFDLKGEGADCVVRRGGPEPARLEVRQAPSLVPTDYSFLRRGHY